MKVTRLLRLTMAATMFVSSVAVGAYGADKEADKAARKVVRTAQKNERKVTRDKCSLGKEPVKVICIGNSLTFHGRYDKIGWKSAHGMAASKPEFDYCHMLEKMLREINPESSLTSRNAGRWELDFYHNSPEAVLEDACEGKDIVVIRLGENVPGAAVPDFEEKLGEFISYCQKGAKRVVISGMFWTDDAKEQAIRNCAKKYGITYIPINWIWELHQDTCLPKEGDTLYDTDGNPYQIEGRIYITHPNDAGMEKIATSIFNSL